jgi:uncharacterized membrane protein YoaT (DUF817 family)
MTKSTFESAAQQWPLLARFLDVEHRWAERFAHSRLGLAAYEFLRFGVKQAWACLFGGLMVGLLIATHLWYPRSAALARYDFLVLASIAIQIVLLWLKMETWEEAKVILLFHLVGTIMEVFKTAVGSWTYPEQSLLRIGGVPLFTGFMYASIGSYMARSWRLFDFRFTRHPPLWTLGLLSLAIYANFFTNHWGYDVRVWLFVGAAILLGPGLIHYRVWRTHRTMPLLLACGLTAVFIWIAENIGTYTNAWLYPHQGKEWSLVGFSKFSSWFLLLIISYVMVALVNRPERLDDK